MFQVEGTLWTDKQGQDTSGSILTQEDLSGHVTVLSLQLCHLRGLPPQWDVHRRRGHGQHGEGVGRADSPAAAALSV